MNFLIRLIFFLALTCFMSPSTYSSEPQDSNETGFQLKLINEPVIDSSSMRSISLDEIKSFPIHSIELPDHKTNEIIIWRGVYLKEVVQKFLDIAWEKIDRLIIKAPDGYSSVVSGLRMKRAETALCAFAMQNKDWPQKFGYLRIIFQMYWMNNPAEVELILKNEQEQKPTWKFMFFDSPVFHSFQANKNEKDFTGWSVNDILTTMDRSNTGFGVFTLDGHVREYLFDEIAQKMKLAPDSTGYWKIRGERIPIGFRLRKIFFLYSEHVGVFTKSLTPAEQLLWQDLFALIQPLVSQGFSANEITLVLASGEKILSRYFDDYRAGKISLYQLLQMENDARSDLASIEVMIE